MDLPKEIQDLMPSVMLNAVDALHQLNQTPLEMSLPAVLASVNVCTHALTDVDTVGFGIAPISLFMCTVSASGTKKSTTAKAIQEGIMRYEREYAKMAKQDLYDYGILHKKWEKDHEGVLLNVKDAKDYVEPLAPPSNEVIVTKATLNGLIMQLSDTQHCGLMNADAGNFFSSHAFQNAKNGADIELLVTLSAMYSGERVSTQTGVRQNNITIDDRRFMMFTMLQESLAGFLNNPKYIDQGFVPRTLVSVVPPTQTEFRQFRDANHDYDKLTSGPLKVFNDRCYELLCQVGTTSAPTPVSNKLTDIREQLRAQTNNGPADPKELSLPVMRQTAEAEEAYGAWRDHQHNVLMKQTMYKDIESFMNRRYENAVRVAASCAVFNGDKEITLEMACLSIGIIDWYTDQKLKQDLSTCAANPVVADAIKVHKWMLKYKVRAPFTKSSLQQGAPSVYREADQPYKDRLIAEMNSRDMISINTDGNKMVYTPNEV